MIFSARRGPVSAGTAVAASIAIIAGAGTSAAATIRVGPGQAFAAPSAAIATAAPGDTVLIAPGEYYDCAVVHANNVTIAGDGEGVVLTDTTCQGKAILVTTGHDITVRGLMLRRARVPDQNGAGIRAEGDNLTIDHVSFVDNEDGILAADTPASTIRILDSEFVHNGRCPLQCAHAVYVGALALLDIERTRFSDTQQGHDIKSRATRTVLLGNTISDGPTGTSSYLVELPDGGDLVMHDNTLEKGARSGSMLTAIMIGSERAGPSDARQVITGNRFINDTGARPAFVLNWGSASPDVTDNVLPDDVTGLSSRGSLLHWIHYRLYEAKVFVLSVVGFAKRAAHKVLAMIV